MLTEEPLGYRASFNPQSQERVAQKSGIRTLIVNEYAIVSAGLRLLLNASKCISVVGEAASSHDAITIALREKPDVVLLDLDFIGYRRLGLITELLTAAENTAVLVLTGLQDKKLCREAVRHGVRGVVVKNECAAVLLKAIERIHAGELWVEQSIMAALIGELQRNKQNPYDSDEYKIASLTAREREVIRLVGQGLRNKEIADRLHISETTVRHHLTAVFSKLAIADRLTLAIYAFKHGLAPAPAKASNG